MPSIKHRIKTAAEGLIGRHAWLEPSSDLGDIRAWISSVRPQPTASPLIRVGRVGDGGYVVPNDLDGLAASISPGVSTEISFDIKMAERGIPVFMADASVDGPPSQSPLFHFRKKFVDVFEDESHIRLDSMCDLAPDGDLILQMDIEGAEYRTLLDLSDEALRRFRVLIVEFHFLTKAFGLFPLEIIRATFNKLERHHVVVHIHPNNVCKPTVRGDIAIPPVMEFIFWRKDRAVLNGTEPLQFPHPLDVDNIPQLPTLTLPDCWWRD